LRNKLKLETTNGVSRAGESALLLLSPAKMVIYGWIFYLLVFLIAPITVVFGLDRAAVLYIATCYAMFLAGCLAYCPLMKIRKVRAVPSQRGYRRLFHFVLFVALIGIGLRVYDRFFVRGASLVQDVMERRVALEYGGSNIFSLGAAALYPFCFVLPFIYFLVARQGKRRPYALLLSLLVFCFPALNAILIGSRSILVTTVLLLFLYLLYFGVVRFTIRTVIISFAALLLVFTLSTNVFLNRLEAMGLPADVSVYQSGYAFTVQPNEWISDSMDHAQNQLLYETYLTYLNFSQYCVHGLFEFSYLYDNFRGAHTMGADTFSIYYKLVAFLFRLPSFDKQVLDAEPNPGVFTTFFGPLYVDFGWLGPLVLFVFGLGAQRLWTSAKLGNVNLLPLYFYAAIVMFASPVLNMISGAEGLFVATSFAVYYLLSRIVLPQGPLA
jgi:hypothetical protein